MAVMGFNRILMNSHKTAVPNTLIKPTVPKKQFKLDKKTINLVIIGVVLVVIGIVGYFGYQYYNKNYYEKDHDAQVIENFSDIQNKIADYYKANKKLPDKLSDVKDLSFAEGGYEFQKSDETIYKLCSDFVADSPDFEDQTSSIVVSYKKGRDCVTFNISSMVPTVASSESLAEVQKANLATVARLDSATITSSTATLTTSRLNFTIDPTRSHFYSANDTDYLLNLYLTITPADSCSKTNKCCYNLSSLTMSDYSGNLMTKNMFNTPSYINVSQLGEDNSFGDLPVNYCFSTNSGFTGGFGYFIPKTMLDSGSAASLQIKYNESGKETDPISIGVGL